MRRIQRKPLPPTAAAAMDRDTKKIAAHVDPKAEAARIWEVGRAALEDVQRVLRDEMAPGGRCMYCEDNEGTDIEHFRPRSRYPEETLRWENLLWACSACNSNCKREQFPVDAAGAALLLDPTDPTVDPLDHLELAPRTGDYLPRSDRGRESHAVFGLGRKFLTQRRSVVFRKLLEDMVHWHNLTREGKVERAEYLAGLLPREPHASVLRDFVRLAESPGWRGLADDCRTAGDLAFADALTEAVSVLAAQRATIDAWCAGL